MSKEVAKNTGESPEEHTVDSRQKARDQLQAQMDAFVSGGGKVQEVDAHVTADPPQKPGNNYCSRPI